jgi:type IV pilus assembly protein PilA
MLKKIFKQFKCGQKGFTLIELLVVVAILGVLAAVAIPNVAKFIGSGKSESARTEIANIQTAVTAYMADNKYSYATTDGTSGGGALTSALLLSGGYLLQTPKGAYTIAADGTVTQTASGY